MTQNRYDQVPYFSHPFPQTHPESLYTIARLFGVDAPDYKQARVLELGCAGGGNLIPMAVNLPDSQFVGIDLSAKQIESGLGLVKALELTNLSLVHLSINDIQPEFGQFDYIICHGVFSWVAPDTQEKIFSICNHNLTACGVAYISYNCLPGWNFIKSIRDMMLYHVAGFEDPAEKAEQARSMLQFILDSQDRTEPAYAAYLKSEMELLSRHRDAYLLHDHLEDINAPLYFHNFMERADRQHLTYLGDTDLFTMYPENLDEAVAATLLKIPDIIKAEQYMDFIRNRRFRSTLLCHASLDINRRIDVDAIDQFHLTTLAFPDVTVESDPLETGIEDGVPMTFSSGSATLQIRGRIPKTAMLILAECSRQPLDYEVLCRETMRRTGILHIDYIREQLNEDLNLIRLLFAGMIQISSSKGPYTIRVPDLPKVTRMVQLQAADSDMVTNQRHSLVYLNSAEQIMVRYLDGRTPHAQLVDKLCSHIHTGELKLELNGCEVPATEDIAGHVALLCSSILDSLAEKALLI